MLGYIKGGLAVNAISSICFYLVRIMQDKIIT